MKDPPKKGEARSGSPPPLWDLFENSVLGIYRTTPDGRILLANPAIIRMLGYSSFDELARRNLEEEGFEPGYERCAFKERIERDGEIVGLETAWTKRDGSTLFVRENARAVRDDSGTVLYYDGTVEDITDRKRAEEELRASEARYRALVENVQDGVFQLDPDRRFTYVNDLTVRRSGRPRQWFMGRDAVTVARPEDREATAQMLHRVLAGESVLSQELGYLTQSGELIHIEINAAPLRDGNEIVGVLGISRDITERKRTEAELARYREHLQELVESRTRELRQANRELERQAAERERAQRELQRSEHWYRALIEQGVSVYAVVDADGEVRYASPSVERLYGWRVDEVLGRSVFEHVHPADLDYARRALAGLLAEPGRVGSVEVRYQHRNGWWRGLAVTGVNLLHDPIVGGIVLSCHDVTERNQAEDALRESEQKYRQLFATVSDAITIFDAASRRFVDVNEAAARLYGYSRSEFLTLRHADILADPERSERTVRDALRQGPTRGIVRHHKKRDGTVFPVEISASDFVLGNRRVLFGVIRDITERRKAEDELRRSQQLMRQVADATPDILCAFSLPERHLLFVNKQVERLLGYTVEQAHALADHAVETLVHPEDQEGLADHIDKLVSGQANGVIEREFRVRHANGQWRWMHARDVAFGRDAAGRPTQHVGLLQDITARKEADRALRAARRKLLTAREEERRRLARELHDSVVQRIIAMRLDLKGSAGESTSRRDDPLTVAVADIDRQSFELIQEVRRISHGLYPPTLEQFGLPASLSQLAGACREAGLHAEVHCESVGGLRFPADVEFAVFRIAQEAVNNVLRHARARHVKLLLGYRHGRLALEVADDGVGFDPAGVRAGMGLNSMQDRVAALDGKLDITCSPGRTSVQVGIPTEAVPARPRGGGAA